MLSGLQVFVDFRNHAGDRGIDIGNCLYGLHIAERLACRHLILRLRKINEYEISHLILRIVCHTDSG